MRTILLFMLAFMVVHPAAAASWPQVRDQAMTLREKGRAPEGYAMAAGASPGRADERADQQFVAGFIALRDMGAATQATAHFVEMAKAAAGMKGWSGESARSKAGYWIAESLEASGRHPEAVRFRGLASGYRDTFYGMMAAAKTKAEDTREKISVVRSRYPSMDLMWHDNRLRRELVFAVIKAETEFRPRASPKGAQGLMQVMPGTAKHVGDRAGIAIDVAMLAANGAYNVAIGSKYLGDLLTRYDGNVPMATAAYNAGENRVDDWVRRFGDPRAGTPPIDWIERIPFRETREYVQKVYSNYLAYLALERGG